MDGVKNKRCRPRSTQNWREGRKGQVKSIFGVWSTSVRDVGHYPDTYRSRSSGMQDTIAGNTNAGKVMRKNTPREHSMPNENAVQDTFA